MDGEIESNGQLKGCNRQTEALSGQALTLILELPLAPLAIILALDIKFWVCCLAMLISDATLLAGIILELPAAGLACKPFPFRPPTEP